MGTRRIAVVALGGCALATVFLGILDACSGGVAPSVMGLPSEGGVEASSALDASSNDASATAVDAASLCPSACLPRAPAGWLGPSAVYAATGSDEPPSCPASHPQKQVVAREATTTPAVCTCASCKATCLRGLTIWADGGSCGSGVRMFSAWGGECRKLPPGADHVFVDPVVRDGRATLDASIPAPFAASYVACATAQTIACGDRSDCLEAPSPDAPGSRTCIHTQGDVPCPSGEYVNRSVGHRRVTDRRGCGPCTVTFTGDCNDAGAPFEMLDQACQPIGATGAPGVCVALSVGAGAIAAAPTTLACTATSLPTGGLALSDPITFCCR